MRLIILGVAAVAAVAAAFLVRGLVAKPAPQPVAASAPIAKPATQVLVAKRDLPVGTRLTAADLTWQPWPADAVNPAFVTNGAVVPVSTVEKATEQAKVLVGDIGPMAAFEGALVRESLLANEPVTAAKVVRGGEGGYMSVVLAPGMRAMAVPVSVESGAGGFILPGDHVDVLQSRATSSAQGANGPTARTVVQNLRVLAIDQTTKAEKDAKTVVGAVATLEVPMNLTEAMARAKAGGDLSLALRPVAEAAGPVQANDATLSTIKVFRGADVSEVAVQR